MTRARRALVNVVITLVVGGHLVALAVDPRVEAWPFSQYPMYSRRSALFPQIGQRRLVAIARDDAGREIPLVDPRYLAPLDVEYVNGGFARILGARDQTRLEEALSDCARRYEDNRRRGLHRGPPLGTLRLYRLVWHVEGDLENVDRPDAKLLLAEYHVP